MRSHYALPVLLGLMALPLTASAHHSQAMYDNTQELTISGVVSDFEWINPHTWLHVMVKDEGGVDRMWTFESNSTGQLERGGWSREAILPGDEVSIVYRPLRDGTRGGSIRAVLFPDGRQLLHPGIGGYDPTTGTLNTPPPES